MFYLERGRAFIYLTHKISTIYFEYEVKTIKIVSRTGLYRGNKFLEQGNNHLLITWSDVL